MQDRFKFRVWLRYSERLIYVNNQEEDLYSFLENVNDRYIPMQCTGLKDKNGKLIYEGDIVKIGNGSVNGLVIETIRKIEWSINCFNVPSWITDKPDFSHYVIVIGNIYENPELLED